MRLFFHLLRKDLVRVRLFAALLLVIVALRPILGVILLTTDDWNNLDFPWFGQADDYLLLAHLLGAWLLTLWLVQLDAPRRTIAFLHTRPVSRLTLGAAKVATAWLIGAIGPTLVLTPWWYFGSLRSAEFSALAFTYVSGLGFATLLALIVGACVDNFQRAILWSAALWVTAACVSVLVFDINAATDSPRLHGIILSLWRTVPGALSVFAVGLTCVALLFRRRSPWLGLAATGAIIGLVGYLLGSSYRPTAPDAHEFTDTVAVFSDLEVKAVGMIKETPRGKADALAGQKRGHTHLPLAVTGLGEHTLIGYSHRMTMSDANGRLLELQRPVTPAMVLLHLGNRLPFKPSDTDQPAPPVEMIAPLWWMSDAQELAVFDLVPPLRLRSELTLELYRPELRDERTLSDLSWRRLPGYGTSRLVHLRRANESTDDRSLFELRATLNPDGPWNWTGLRTFSPNLSWKMHMDSQDMTTYVVDKAHPDRVLSTGPSTNLPSSQAVTLAGLRLTRRPIYPNNHSSHSDLRWVTVRYVKVAQLTRPLDVSGLAIQRASQ